MKSFPADGGFVNFLDNDHQPKNDSLLLNVSESQITRGAFPNGVRYLGAFRKAEVPWTYLKDPWKRCSVILSDMGGDRGGC